MTSILALCVSIISIILTLYYNRQQNLRWDAQNLGRIGINEVYFLMWKEFTKKEALSKNWGYEPILIPYIENNLVSDKIRIPYELMLVDSDTLKRIPKSNGFFTISDCKKEAERLKIKEDNYTILKHFRIRFNFKNIGSTFIKNIKMFINMVDPKIELPNKTMIGSIELLPSSKTGCEVDLVFEMDDIIPDILKFEVCINYIDANTNYNERKIPVTYNFKENCWFYSRY